MACIRIEFDGDDGPSKRDVGKWLERESRFLGVRLFARGYLRGVNKAAAVCAAPRDGAPADHRSRMATCDGEAAPLAWAGPLQSRACYRPRAVAGVTADPG